MVDRIKANTTTIVRFFFTFWGSLSTLVGVWLSFCSWEDMGITGKFTRILILLGIILLSAVGATIVVFCRKKKRIIGDINKGVVICYGDVLRLGFPRKEQKRIVVIPVNRCFDLSCEGNLISRRSIHGQWIEKYINNEKERRELSQRIQKDLDERGATYDTLQSGDKCDGNLRRYQAGTVVEVKGKNGIIFYLLALSAFDKELRAHCSEMEFYETMQGLLEYYDIHGMGEDLYCPVMGDHIVRPTRDTHDIISLMLSVFRFNSKKIHGNIHLVVYDKMKAEVPILEY